MFDAGIAAVDISKVGMEEMVMLREADMAGNASLGITVDEDRRQVVVVFADVIGHKHSAVAAYDLDTWERNYLTHLSGTGIKYTMNLLRFKYLILWIFVSI